MTGFGLEIRLGQHQSKSSFCLTNLVSALTFSLLSLTCSITFALTAGLAAQAQFGGAQPPPIGSGDTPSPVTPGDTSGGSNVTSGQADPTPGTNNAVGTGHDRTVVRIFEQTAGRGSRMIQTLRPDTLSDEARTKIEGILGINMLSGEQAIDVTATKDQIAQIQDALAAYPQTTDNGGRKKITADNPAAGYPKPNRNSIYKFDNQLPTVATFARYLVILGHGQSLWRSTSNRCRIWSALPHGRLHNLENRHHEYFRC